MKSKSKKIGRTIPKSGMFWAYLDNTDESFVGIFLTESQAQSAIKRAIKRNDKIEQNFKRWELG